MVNNVVFGLLLARHETTTNMSGNAILSLLQNRESWDAIVEDPTLIPNAMEECLRFRPSVVAWRRLAKVDVEIAMFMLGDAGGDSLSSDRLWPQLRAMEQVEPLLSELLEDIYANYLNDLKKALEASGANHPKLRHCA